MQQNSSRSHLIFGNCVTPKLIALAQNTSNPRNHVPAALKTSIGHEVNSAFDSLFQTCERLQVVAHQGVSPARLRTELQEEHLSLQQLLEATEDANAEIARLTLSAGRAKVSDASDKFARLGWAARELTRFNQQIEGES